MKRLEKEQPLRSIDWALFRTRAKMLTLIRTFFNERGFLEVESPVLTPYPTLDMNIKSIGCRFASDTGTSLQLFMHTSPEHAMKKMLAMGAGPVFYLGKVFRNGELTPMHNPEFTMLEWYRPDAGLPAMQQDCTDLIVFLAGRCLDSPGLTVNGRTIPLSSPFQVKSLCQCFLEKTGIDLKAGRSLPVLKAGADTLGIPYAEDDDWQSLFFRIFLERIEPWLGFEAPLFVSEYPAEMALMARLNKEDPEWAERCELYIGGIELANGYAECTDSAEMSARFDRERALRERAGLGPALVDDALLKALDRLPPSAGISLGIDRLIMLFTGKSHIREVLLFPLHDYVEAEVRS